VKSSLIGWYSLKSEELFSIQYNVNLGMVHSGRKTPLHFFEKGEQPNKVLAPKTLLFAVEMPFWDTFRLLTLHLIANHAQKV
jgi:hypothetical protein